MSCLACHIVSCLVMSCHVLSCRFMECCVIVYSTRSYYVYVLRHDMCASPTSSKNQLFWNCLHCIQFVSCFMFHQSNSTETAKSKKKKHHKNQHFFQKHKLAQEKKQSVQGQVGRKRVTDRTREGRGEKLGKRVVISALTLLLQAVLFAQNLLTLLLVSLLLSSLLSHHLCCSQSFFFTETKRMQKTNFRRSKRTNNQDKTNSNRKRTENLNRASLVSLNFFLSCTLMSNCRSTNR